MKILFLNHNPPGIGTYHRCFFLGKYLSHIGNDVTLMCKSEKNFDLSISVKTINENMRIITLPRIKLHKYADGHLLRSVIGSFKALSLDYDLIHSFAVAQPSTAIPAMVSKWFKKKPLLVDWDDPWGGGFANYHNFATRYVLETLEKKVPNMADRLTVVSEVLEQRAIEIGIPQELISRIPNGSNVDEITPIPREEAKKQLNLENYEYLVLSLGHTYMGTLKLLFTAWAEVVRTIPEAKLLMVGSIEIPENLKHLYSRLSDSIILAGVQPYEKVAIHLSAANVVVLPMEDNLIERARFPIRLGDYMAAGASIVSNAVGEVKKVIEEGDCGLISEPNSVEGFAENIIRLLQDEKMQQTLGKRARELAERRYAWSKLAENLNKIYVEVLNGF